jgi:hypothetical protein
MEPLGHRDDLKLMEVTALTSDLLIEAASKLRREVPILLEWIFSERDLVQFVDCRTRDNACLFLDLDGMFRARPVIVENTVPANAHIAIELFGNFCSRYTNVPTQPFHARIVDQAVLCHFMTRSSKTPRLVELV